MRTRQAKMWGLVIALASAGRAQVTQRISVGNGGVQGNGDSDGASFSADGRYVAFGSFASNLVPGDTNGAYEAFVRDRQIGTTERVSLDSGGVQGNNSSGNPSLSADARYVAFSSGSTNLVPGDTNGTFDVFVRDRQNGTTERVSVDSGGMQGNGVSGRPSISADGRYVAFGSFASNLVPGDTNASGDVFVRDRQNGTTERVSVDSGGMQGNGECFLASISADGRFIAFYGSATNLVMGDTNGVFDVFVHDRQTGMTERVSVGTSGAQGNDESLWPSISGDGRHVVFSSFASNLVSGDVNGTTDVFVRDRQLGTTERVSVDSGGMQGNSGSSYPSISADGRCVAFWSSATDLVSGDTNGLWDIFVRDRQLGTTERASIGSGGEQGNGQAYFFTTISADGRYVSIDSFATNLVPGDTNGDMDVYVRDRFGGTNFTSLCEPGVAGVIACPCANPSGGFGQGCDNSSVTGGALLSASGGTYLSSDSLVLVTLGERPTALSIVLQGNALIASGTDYGQGVRCAGGALKRLYTKTASGGSISAPDFGAGDPSVSAQSAAKGDPISPGQSRWYLVYYRDPVVLGGCPATSTFNATQTGEVSWSP